MLWDVNMKIKQSIIAIISMIMSQYIIWIIAIWVWHKPHVKQKLCFSQQKQSSLSYKDPFQMEFKFHLRYNSAIFLSVSIPRQLLAHMLHKIYPAFNLFHLSSMSASHICRDVTFCAFSIEQLIVLSQSDVAVY